MIKTETIKKEIKSIAKETYLSLTEIEGEVFKEKYINKEKMFDICFRKTEHLINKWISDLNKNQEFMNLKKEPNYAFIHYLTKKQFPSNYSEEVGILLLDENSLKEFGITKEQAIEGSGNFCFDDFYCDTMYEYLELNLDKEITNITDRTKMNLDYKDSSIEDYASITADWENILFEELSFISKIFWASVSNTALNLIENKKLN